MFEKMEIHKTRESQGRVMIDTHDKDKLKEEEKELSLGDECKE